MAQMLHYSSHGVVQPVSPLETDFPPLPSLPSRGHSRNEGDHGSLSSVSPIIMSRRTSHESDRQSTGSGLTTQVPSNPANVNPAPAYVAAFGASQVVSEHLASQNPPESDSEDEDQRDKDDVHFSAPALALANAFLDHLLYSFLSAAQSTSLTALRPGVTEVLKRRLAKEAIASADIELAELLAGGEEEEEIDSRQKVQEDKRTWDLELVWKRTRLRVMVYMRLGEMEDDDEQRYVESEELFYGSENRFSSSTGLVSWSAAIFLTSVLEYVAEQTLQVVGQAAYNRIRRQDRSHRRSMSSDAMIPEHISIEEHDVEKIALSSTLGRLWRTWRKSLRSAGLATTPTQRFSPVKGRSSRENTMSSLDRSGDISIPRDESTPWDSRPISRDQANDASEIHYAEHILAANIPLPIADHTRDIDEIVVPGLAKDPDIAADPDNFFEGPYPSHVLAVLVALPSVNQSRDIDEIEIPGLAKDPDADDTNEEATVAPKQEIRRNSFSGRSIQPTIVGLPTLDDAASSLRKKVVTPPVRRPRSTSLAPTFTTEASQATEASGTMAMEQEPWHEREQSTRSGLEQSTALNANGASAISDRESNIANSSKALLSGAAAGTAAAAAAAAAGASFASNLPEDVSDMSVDSRNMAEMVEDEDIEESQMNLVDDKAVEEIDNRKSLLDIKQMHSMMAADGSSAGTSGQESPYLGAPGTAVVERSVPNGVLRDESEANDDLSLDDTDMQGEIETARNVGFAGTIARNATDQQTREEGGSTSKPPNRQYLDLTSEEEPSTHQPLSLAKPASQDPDLTHETSRALSTSEPTAESINNARTAHQKQASDSKAAQEHPIVERMASRNGSHPSSRSGSEKVVPLMSSSIKGPEDFDLFVQGGETLKYTLTPEQVRDEVVVGDTRTTVFRETPMETDGASPARQTPLSADGRAGRLQVSPGQDPTAEKRRSQSRPSPTNTSIHSKTGLLAREPRVSTLSTRDFADFIRSTGPNKDATVYPLLSKASSASLHSLRSANVNGTSNSRSSSPGADRSRNLIDGNAPPVPPIPQRTRPELEARGAKVGDAGSSELIDFIRSGPKADGEHRIPRSIAPFRTTMDSDQSHDLNARNSTERQVDAGVSGTSPLEPSQRRSANGTSGIDPATQLGRSWQAQGLPDPPRSTTDNAAAPESESTRKRYRNRDPYAIDFEDEDDDLVINRPKSSRKDESFLDFLKNHEPPSSGAPRLLIDPNSAQARRIINNARAGIPPTDTASRTTRSNVGPRVGSQPAPQLVPADRQAQINSTVTSSRPKLEAKSSGSKNRYGTSALNTNDLADFIRNSGPADDQSTTPAPAVGGRSKPTGKDEKQRSKVGRKKLGSFFSGSKNTRYLDMP